MAQRVFQQSYHVPGTLAANVSIVFTTPFDCQLLHVSAVGSNTNNGLLSIGTTAAAEAYLASASIGDANLPAEFDRQDFVGGQYPHIPRGTAVAIALDYDGAGGTATQNFTLVLTFTEG